MATHLFLACLALTFSAIAAQPAFDYNQQYQGYNAQDQYQQQQQQQYSQQPQPTYKQYQQSLQQYQTQPQQQQQYQPTEKIGFETPDLLPAGKSPLKNLDEAQGNRQYVDFINQLYRLDRTKPALHFDNHGRQARQVSDESHSRQKRAIIFRPMFVYRQQKLRKERISGQKTTPAPPKTEVSANKSQLYKDKQNHVYREYNSFYDPYRYGQRFPYRP